MTAAAPTAPVYTESTVRCDGLVKVSGTNYPAAIVDIDPPSVLAAAATVHVMPQNGSFDDGWVQAGTGGVIRSDGSAVAVQCPKATDSVTFFVPEL